MKALAPATIAISRAPRLPMLAAAVALMLGCTTAAELTPADHPLPNGESPGATGKADDVAALRSYRRVTGPSGGERRTAFPIGPAEVALFRVLVSKPAARPLSTLHRLFFFLADTTFDLLNPRSLAPTGEAPVLRLSGGPSMDLEAWERKLDELTGSTASNGTIEFLIDGDEFFPRLVDAVMSARDSVDIRTYIFDTDDYATAFADFLKRRSEDVDVKVLVDGLGTMVAAGMTPSSMPADFDQPGWIEHYLEKNSDIAVRLSSNAWFTGDHTKTFIIDRRVAFVGGMNIGREYRYDWHDLMMEVRGPVVDVLDREFHKAWSRAGFFGELGYLAYSLRPKRETGSGAGHPIRVLFTKPGDSQIYRTQLAAIRAARQYIYIENPYFSDNQILHELVAARRRGVDVRVILPLRGDSGLMDRSNVVVANTMLRNGIRVFIYPGFAHAKAAIFDGWACLGSANLDKMSLRVNEELNLATSHEATVAALREQLFEPDFAKSAEMTEPFQKDWSYHLAAFLADQL